MGRHRHQHRALDDCRTPRLGGRRTRSYPHPHRRRPQPGAEARAAHGPTLETHGRAEGRGTTATGGGCYACRTRAQLRRGEKYDFASHHMSRRRHKVFLGSWRGPGEMLAPASRKFACGWPLAAALIIGISANGYGASLPNKTAASIEQGATVSSEQLPSSCPPRQSRCRAASRPVTAYYRASRATRAARSVMGAHRGTRSSNPSPSSGESTNHRFLSGVAKSAASGPDAPPTVPEPASLALLGTALASLGLLRRKSS